jgi:hypothetical protein
MTKQTVCENLSVRAGNALCHLFLGSFYTDRRDEIDAILGLSRSALKKRLVAYRKGLGAPYSKAPLRVVLLRARGCGQVAANEILRWIGELVPTDEHTCICRRCGRKMKQTKRK